MALIKSLIDGVIKMVINKTTTTILQPFFREQPGDPVPEENFWTGARED